MKPPIVQAKASGQGQDGFVRLQGEVVDNWGAATPRHRGQYHSVGMDRGRLHWLAAGSMGQLVVIPESFCSHSSSRKELRRLMLATLSWNHSSAFAFTNEDIFRKVIGFTSSVPRWITMPIRCISESHGITLEHLSTKKRLKTRSPVTHQIITLFKSAGASRVQPSPER